MIAALSDALQAVGPPLQARPVGLDTSTTLPVVALMLITPDASEAGRTAPTVPPDSRTR